MELVRNHDVNVRAVTVAQRPVRKDFSGAANDWSVGVDGPVAGDHPHTLWSELPTQLKELLADQCLDGGGVHAALITP